MKSPNPKPKSPFGIIFVHIKPKRTLSILFSIRGSKGSREAARTKSTWNGVQPSVEPKHMAAREIRLAPPPRRSGEDGGGCGGGAGHGLIQSCVCVYMPCSSAFKSYK